MAGLDQEQKKIFKSVKTSLAEVAKKLPEAIDRLEEHLLEVWQMQEDLSMPDVDLEVLFGNIKQTSDGLAIESSRIQECRGALICFRMGGGVFIDFSDLVCVLKEMGALDEKPSPQNQGG